MVLFPDGISTTRLQLRRYRAGDACWYAEMALRNRIHLARYESGNAAMRIDSAADAATVLGEFADLAAAGKACFLGAFLAGTETFVGQIYIGIDNADLPGFVLGYFCDEAHLRQGYLSEATAATLADLFDTCGAERVGLGCDDSNLPSRRIAERLGMHLEGHLRANKRNADGSITGSLLYGILRHEFMSQRNRTRH